MAQAAALPAVPDMRDLAEARARYLRTGEVSAAVRPVVLASWERCRAYGVDPLAIPVQVPDPAAVQVALAANARLIECGADILQQMHATLGDEPHLIALTDSDGVVLVTHSAGAGTAEELRAANLFVGASWHERYVGCNGAATSLAAGQPVVLIGPEHFAELYAEWTCIGVPIRDPGGRAVGALDVSVPRGFTNVHLWGWTLAVARSIEDTLARWLPGSVAEAELAVPDVGSPLQTVRGIIEFLGTQLNLSPTHARLFEGVRSELDAAAEHLQHAVDALIHSGRTARRESTEIEALYATAPVGLCMLDPGLRYLRINRRLAEINGIPPEEHVGRTLAEVLPELARTAEPLLQEVLASGKPALGVELSGETPARPGETRAWLAHYLPLLDEHGHVFAINLVVEDVTEQKRAERELASEREFLRSLIDTIPAMVTVYDPAIREISVNHEFVRLLGWSNEELRRVNVMEAVYPDPAYRAEVARFMASLDGWRDLQLTAKDGTLVPSAWANVRMSDGRQVGIGVDLTARKQLEDEVRQAYVQTRRALKERDAVLAVVSHDLRNPLNTIMMASGLIQQDIPEAKRHRQAAIISRAALQMKRLVEDLLQVSRIEAGSYSIACSPCAPADLMRSAMEAMGPLAESQGVELMVATGRVEPDVLVHADAERVHQALTNLVANAIAHTPAGGRVLLDARPDAERFVFRVADTGVGIAPEQLPHVFDRFWQASRRGRAGAGLGLAIVKGIIEAHGGVVWVESQEGSGTTFFFTLPRIGVERG